MSGDPHDSPRAQVDVVVSNEMGLHTRPAKAFVQTAARFSAVIEVTKEGSTVNGKSIMGLMSLLAPKGTRLTITAVGEDAAEAVDILAVVVNKRFGEVE
jgi:phosphocarrier protein HPr